MSHRMRYRVKTENGNCVTNSESRNIKNRRFNLSIQLRKKSLYLLYFSSWPMNLSPSRSLSFCICQSAVIIVAISNFASDCFVGRSVFSNKWIMNRQNETGAGGGSKTGCNESNFRYTTLKKKKKFMSSVVIAEIHFSVSISKLSNGT